MEYSTICKRWMVALIIVLLYLNIQIQGMENEQDENLNKEDNFEDLDWTDFDVDLERRMSIKYGIDIDSEIDEAYLSFSHEKDDVENQNEKETHGAEPVKFFVKEIIDQLFVKIKKEENVFDESKEIKEGTEDNRLFQIWFGEEGEKVNQETENCWLHLMPVTHKVDEKDYKILSVQNGQVYALIKSKKYIGTYDETSVSRENALAYLEQQSEKPLKNKMVKKDNYQNYDEKDYKIFCVQNGHTNEIVKNKIFLYTYDGTSVLRESALNYLGQQSKINIRKDPHTLITDAITSCIKYDQHQWQSDDCIVIITKEKTPAKSKEKSKCCSSQNGSGKSENITYKKL